MSALQQYAAVEADIKCGRFEFCCREQNHNLLQRMLGEHDPSQPSSRNGFGLITLHACGDLSPSTINLFLDNARASMLLNVACCYQSLSVCAEPTETRLFNAFPLSDIVRRRMTENQTLMRYFTVPMMRQATQHSLRKQTSSFVRFFVSLF
jgi:hypothetical protein